MKILLRGLLCAIATAHTTVSVAQSAPPGHAPGTIYQKSVPVDPKAASDRERRQVSDDATQVRRTGERDSYGKGRDAGRRVNPEAESPNRRADSPSRDR